ncbi:MAG TPA: TolC family protein [Gammaproteobacteria bacterium]|nr:TolC family protein [Gammaproteobacteria bacterium]
MSISFGRAAQIFRPIAWATAVLVALAGDASAQHDNATAALEALDRLTPTALVAAIDAANPELLSMAAAAEATALRVVPAGALVDPMLSYGIAPRTIGSDTRHIVEFSQPLPWPGKRGLRRSAAAQDAESVAQAVQMTRLELHAHAQSSFAEWHYLDRAIELNVTTSDLLAELARVAGARYAAGRGSQQDVLQAELEHALLQEKRLGLEHARTALRARINALANRDPAASLPPPTAIPAPTPLPSVDALRRGVELAHPELRRDEARLAATSARRDLADLAFRPDFSANVGYMGIMESDDMRLQVGLSINLPIFREKRRADLDAATADLRRDHYALEAQRTKILAELESAYAHTHHAIEAVGLYESRLLGLAESNLNAALADYRSGAGQFLVVVDAERRLLAIREAHERARADYWRMRAELDLAAGGTLSAAEQAIPLTSRVPR